MMEEFEELLGRLKADYPDIRFRRGRRFKFVPPATVVMGPFEKHSSLLILHEMGHLLAQHKDFRTEAERLRKEREAWEVARGLCEKYGVTYDEAVVEYELDSYREWLDKKSRCPECGLTRFQTPDGAFHCPRCESF